MATKIARENYKIGKKSFVARIDVDFVSKFEKELEFEGVSKTDFFTIVIKQYLNGQIDLHE